MRKGKKTLSMVVTGVLVSSTILTPITPHLARAEGEEIVGVDLEIVENEVIVEEGVSNEVEKPLAEVPAKDEEVPTEVEEEPVENEVVETPPISEGTDTGGGIRATVEPAPLATVTAPTALATLFPDVALRTAVAQALGVDPTASVTQTQLNSINALGAKAIQSVANLQGIEYLTKLTNLSLGSGTITSLAPLATMTQLQYLYITSNNITDISAINNLVNLRVLSLGTNRITDLSTVTWSRLTYLRELYISSNRITDITPLNSLNNSSMQILSMGSNRLTDLSPIINLTNLRELYAGENTISNLAPVTNMTNLRILSLGGNRLTNANLGSIANLTNLEQLWLGRNSISSLTNIQNLTNLTQLYVAGNMITDISPLSNMTRLRTLAIENNQIASLVPLANIATLASVTATGQTISLTPNAYVGGASTPVPLLNINGIAPYFGQSGWTMSYVGNVTYSGPTNANVVWRSAGNNSMTVGVNIQRGTTVLGTFSATLNQTVLPDPNPATPLGNIQDLFSDTNFANVIASLTGKTVTGSVTQADLDAITELKASGQGISTLGGLQFLRNVTNIDLSHNNISDLSRLVPLANITTLDVSDNNISNLTPLANTMSRGITTLIMDRNHISDKRPLNAQPNIQTISSLDQTIYLPDVRLGDTTNFDLFGRGWGASRLQLIGANGQPLPTTIYYENRGVGVLDWDSIGTKSATWSADRGGATGDFRFTGTIYQNVLEQLHPFTYYFPDLNLATTVANALGRTAQDAVTETELASIRTMENVSNVTTLEGLGYLKGLTWLSVSSSTFPNSELSLVGSLSNLTYLSLVNNRLTDISSLSTLTNLQTLVLSSNQITSLSPLSSLSQLSVLNVDNNSVSSLSPISSLSLTELHAANNRISSVGDLNSPSLVANLKVLDLGRNSLAGSLPASFAQLTNLVTLNLNNNGITVIASLNGLVNMQTLSLQNNQIADVSAIGTMTNLRRLAIDNNKIANLSPLAPINDNLDVLTARNQVVVGPDWDIDAVPYPLGVYGANGIMATTSQVTIPTGVGTYNETNGQITWTSIGNNTVTWTIGSTNSDIFTGSFTQQVRPSIAADPDAAMTGVIRTLFPDPALAQLVVDTLNQLATNDPTLFPNGADFTVDSSVTFNQLSAITALTGGGLGIRNLEGLQFLKNLADLELPNNNIADLQIFAGRNANLTDVNGLFRGTPLFSNLTHVNLDNNNIRDLQFLANMENTAKNIVSISLNGNHVTDLRPIRYDGTGFTHLSTISVQNQTLTLDPVLVGTSFLTVQNGPTYPTAPFPIAFVYNPGGAGTRNGYYIPTISANGTITNGGTLLSVAGSPGTDAGGVVTWNALGTGTLTWNTEISNAPYSLQFSGVITQEVVDSTYMPINSYFPDPELASAVAEALGRTPLSSVTTATLATITNVRDMVGVEDLTGSNYLTGLTAMNIDKGRFTDLSPLANLTENLKDLSFTNGVLEDVDVLGGLSALEDVILDGNHIADLSSLGQLEHLTTAQAMNQTITLRNIGVNVANAIGVKNVDGEAPNVERGDTVTLDDGTYANGQVTWKTVSSNTLDFLMPVSSAFTGEFSGKVMQQSLSTIAYYFPDPVLATAVAEQLSKSVTAPVTLGELATITTLADMTGVGDLEGSQHLINLGYLNISQGTFPNEDLDLLEDLISLQELDLVNGTVSDISALSSLTNLVHLNLYENQIANVSPLENLTNLNELNLGKNQITNIDPLGELPHLTMLSLADNEGISSFDAIPLLQQDGSSNFIWSLDLSGTGLDNTELEKVTALPTLEYLNVSNNQLSDLSPLNNMISMRNLLANDNQLADLSNVNWAIYTMLLNLWLNRNEVEEVTPLAQINSPHLVGVYLDSNHIRDISPLQVLMSDSFPMFAKLSADDQTYDLGNVTVNVPTATGVLDINSLAPSAMTPSPTSATYANGDVTLHAFGSYQVKWEEGFRVTIPALLSRTLGTTGITPFTDPSFMGTFSGTLTIGADDRIANIFPDDGLAAAVADALGVSVDTVVTVSQLAGLTNLDASYRGITDLTNIGQLTGLLNLNLDNNELVDISPLSSLTTLTGLTLRNNHIRDLRPIAASNLPNLTNIVATGQSITLPEVRVGTGTQITLYNRDGTVVVLAPEGIGTYVNGVLTWSVAGNPHLLEFASGYFTGTISQVATEEGGGVPGPVDPSDPNPDPTNPVDPDPGDPNPNPTNPVEPDPSEPSPNPSDPVPNTPVEEPVLEPSGEDKRELPQVNDTFTFVGLGSLIVAIGVALGMKKKKD